MEQRKTPEVVTFGCRLNTYESEVMKGHAKRAGLEDAIIFNTCAVTKEAERQARQAIRRARRENPDAKIIVTGCAAQIDPAGYASMPEVDQVIGNDLKLKEDTWTSPSPSSHSATPRLSLPACEGTPSKRLAPLGGTGGEGGKKIRVNDIMVVKETAGHLIAGFEDRARAFVQVQNGCDHRCTFCIIPYGRGNSRSVPVGEIVDQVRGLAQNNYQEIVLTGVDITSYGHDLPAKPPLGQMIRRLLTLVPEVKRLRLSSLDPVEIDEDLWHLIAHEPRLMPHLHLSLQAGDDMILKRMKRRHLRQDVIDVCQKARVLRPDMAFGADIIAGFPTETDEMFENTLKIVEDCDLTFLHVFPYSARSGTPAAKMPQVPLAIRKERAARLRDAGARQVEKFLNSRIGKTESILVEKDRRGHTEHFAPVRLNGDHPLGTIVQGKVAAVSDGALIIA